MPGASRDSAPNNEAKESSKRNNSLSLDASYLLDTFNGSGDDDSSGSFLGEGESPHRGHDAIKPSESLAPSLQFQTPAKESKKQNGLAPQLLSPFSPLLQPGSIQRNRDQDRPRPEQVQRGEEDGQQAISWAPPASFVDNDLSLYPCRKVSVVVHVSYHSSSNEQSAAGVSPSTSNAAESSATKTPRLCLFPLIHENVTPETINGGNQGIQKNLSTQSPTSATLSASKNAKDLVVVNPKSFGKFIPSEITMETARLVAQVANIESEDWARTYRFQHIIWPDQEVQSLCHLAQAMANDMLSGKTRQEDVPNNKSSHQNNTNRVVIATGSSDDKTHKLFGKLDGGNKSSSANEGYLGLGKRHLLDQYGLIGVTFHSILKNLPDYAVCALSVCELLEENDIRDLLASPPPSNHKNKPQTQVQLRQSKDRKGAVVEGLTEYPVDSLESLRDCLRPLLVQSSKVVPNKISRCANKFQGGHVVVTLKIWQSAVQQELDFHTRCASLIFVNLAPLHSPIHHTYHQQSNPHIAHHTEPEMPHSPTLSNISQSTSFSLDQRRSRPSQYQSAPQLSARQTAFLRGSVSTLGGVLRGTLLREAGSDAAIPYRNSALTKVLQRPLDNPDCRVVVLTSLSPLSDAYDDTVANLRYVERLLVRSGLPKSPFEKQSPKQSSPQSSPSSPSSSMLPSSPPQAQALMEQFAGKESILESIVTDPRQRLARIYKSQQQLSPTDDSLGGDGRKFEEGESGHAPQETGYMQVDPAAIHPKNENKRKDTKLTGERATNGSRPLAEEQKNETFSSPLARYILPPLSSSSADKYGDESYDAAVAPKGYKSMQHESPDLVAPGPFESIPTRAEGSTYPGKVENENNIASKFDRELATLEKSVNAMKNAHFDIWHSSSFSIQQLKEIQLKQQRTLDALAAERNDAIESARKTQEDLSRLSKRLHSLQKEKDSEIATLKGIVDEARTDRAEVEKIAEEAIAAQDTLEEAVTELEHKLLSNRNSSQAAQEEIKRLLQTKESLAEELHEKEKQLLALKADLNDRENTAAELQFQVNNLQKECDQLSQIQSEKDENLAQLKDRLSRSREAHETELAQLKDSVSSLEREKEALLAERSERVSELLYQLEQTERSLSTCKADQESLQEEISTLQEQKRLMSSTKDQEIARLRQQIYELKDAMKNVEHETDEASVQRDKYLAKYREASQELERTRSELGQRIADVGDLSSSLQGALADNNELTDEIMRKEEALAKFQSETRERVGKVVRYRDDAASLLEQTVQENRALVDTNKQLQDALARMTEERNEALRSHADGRKKQQRSTDEQQKTRRERDSLLTERDNLQEMLRSVQRDRDDLQLEKQQWQKPFSKRQTGFDEVREEQASGGFMRERRTIPEQQLEHRRAGIDNFDQRADLTRRAEEIAACLAFTARGTKDTITAAQPPPPFTVLGEGTGSHLLDENTGNKELSISALKRKVKLLERALIFVEDSARSNEAVGKRRGNGSLPRNW